MPPRRFLPLSRRDRLSGMRPPALFLSVLLFTAPALAQNRAATAPTTAPGKLPHVEVVNRKQVRVDCQSLGVDTPLEFFCVKSSTSEHEAILRTPALPSHVHFALLMLGLEPGKPAHYSDAAQKWLPPSGPPLRITLEWEKDGKLVATPAHRWM